MPTDGPGCVLKIARGGEDRALLEAQSGLMAAVRDGAPEVRCPDLIAPSTASDPIVSIPVEGREFLVRLLTWVDGAPLASLDPADRSTDVARGVGRLMGRVSRALAPFEHPALVRSLDWDLARGRDTVRARLSSVWDDGDRSLVEKALERFEVRWWPLLQHLPVQTLHNDANDHNLILSPASAGRMEVDGIIDFGDAVHSYRVSELAIAATYVLLGSARPIQTLAAAAEGFDSIHALSTEELRLLLPLVELRLMTSVTMSAFQRAREPDNVYLSVSEEAAWSALRFLEFVDRDRATDAVLTACGRTPDRPFPVPARPAGEIRAERERTLIPSLSLSYDRPLHIVRGQGAYLYDAEGHAYLDCVNNVCHVGHSHPRVVRAIADQAALLNTNSRYLHELLATYAERIAATLPDGLDVVAFVSSGSEANELAIRMARTFTGRRGLVVLDGGYHGNTSTLVEASPYKFDGPGGPGRPAWVQVAPMPDPYRGSWPRSEVDEANAALRYADGVRDAFTRAAHRGSHGTGPEGDRGDTRGGAAALLAEAILSCGGQIVPPEGYLRRAYAEAREAGALCIADEVQTGFGRVGEPFWAFALDGAVPDIVTLGKPIGNGHPLGAVVTTRSVADAFATGMEYFATFGGNPVSCAAGLAVLDVLEDESLPAHAWRVGAHLLERLASLRDRDPRVGDVRGRGLFLGIELVRADTPPTPDAELAHALVQYAASRRVLLSTDGPDHNVIKIKPPLVFSREDAERLALVLADGLREAAP